MKYAYPVVLTPTPCKTFVVSIPDFQLDTQGENLPNAIEMARDAIGICGIDMVDCGKTLPKPSSLAKVTHKNPNAIVTLVDIDFTKYRREYRLYFLKNTVRSLFSRKPNDRKHRKNNC